MKSQAAKSKSKASPARIAAFEILLQVAAKKSYASELLHSRARQDLSFADHGLATELVMGTLRWLTVLDDRIARISSQPLTKLDLEVLTSLRLAAYQLLYLDRIPASAAVNESVKLVKAARKHSAAPFVNAILRKLEPSNCRFPDKFALNSTAEIADQLSHPTWMVERWVRRFGLQAARDICVYDQQVPDTALRITDRSVADELENSGVHLAGGRLLNSARILRSGGIPSLPLFEERRITIQDEASQLVALLLGTGKNILDCCAAPGGKTRILAEQNPEAQVFAVDLHPHRARLLRKLVSNKNVAVVAADARALPLRQLFDRVLVDVPCSGTGTLARNPDIKWRLRPDDLIDLQKRQMAILHSALEHTASQGRLVYASCSLEPEENEAVIESTLADHLGVRVLDCTQELERLKASGELAIANPASLTEGRYLRTIPGLHHCDGFFAAVLEKSS